MHRKSVAHWPCSIARTVDIIGDWWTLLILRESFFGATKFDGFQAALGIGRNVLTTRLEQLVTSQLLEKRAYQTNPVRHDYILTERGRDFVGVLLACMRWGDRWLDHGKGPPLRLRHVGCGELTHAEITCATCHKSLTAHDLALELGPGFPSSSVVRRTFAQRLAGASPVRSRASQHKPRRTKGPPQ